MNKVFIANKSYHDYSYAERFGELVFLSNRNVNPIDTSSMVRLVDEFLSDSSPNDKILITGLTIFNSILASYFVHKHNRLNLLIFKRNTRKGGKGEYVLREIMFDNLCKGEE
jgi:hypothetical protein